MQLLKHFKELSIYPKNAKELKGLILQLAVQGKLTVQWRRENLDVEPAKKLLERIYEEKNRLIKEKKIKKEKPLSPITEDEVPYALPEGWVWCRMQEYLDVRDGTHDTPKYVDKGIPLVTSKNLYSKKLDMSNVKFISINDHLEISKRSFVEKFDILFAMIGSIGNPVLVDVEPEFSIKNVALIKYYIKEYCEPKYIIYFLENTTKEFVNDSDGAVQPFVSLTKLRLKKFPLPPLEEQKAIVKTVEQLFKEVEQLENLTEERIQLKEKFATSALNQLTINNIVKEWEYLKPHFNTFFNEEPNIKKLRETILQLAVQGKLTADWRKSNPVIETASELLEKIKAEKEQLVKDKKIKKEKPLPPITESEVSYALPEGWVWSNILDISIKVTDGEHATPKRTDSGFKLLSARNVTNEGIRLHKVDYVGEDEFLRIRRRCNPQKGDVLISCSGSVGRICLVDKDDEYCMVRSAALVKHHHDYLKGKYLVYALRAPIVQDQIIEKSRSTAQSNLFLGKIKELIFPLPPLQEQKAIVEKVNSLMGLCDSLEQEVKQSKVEVEKLMKGVLREVVE
jgi:type I restriction enzyme S subunit